MSENITGQAQKDSWSCKFQFPKVSEHPSLTHLTFCWPGQIAFSRPFVDCIVCLVQTARTIWTLKTIYIDPIYSNPRLKNLLNTLLKPVETLEPRNRNNNSIRPSNMEKAPLVANPIHTSNSGLRHLRTNKTEDVFLLAVLRGQALQ